MATDKKPTPKRRVRKAPTVRQQAESSTKKKTSPKPQRVKKTLKTAGKPVVAVYHFGKKEYYIPLPDNKFWRFMNKRRHIIPRYFVESYRELKKVTWPNRKQTTQLTIAVFVFALTFGALVAITDYGLDRIFKKILIK